MAVLDDLMIEAARCINCKNQPCVLACPAHNQIPELMKKVRIGDFDGARQTWHETSVLSEVCGVLCPHEALCEGHCTLNKLQKPIKIGWIEEQMSILYKDKVDYPFNKINKKHLVIGLGPAGISNALRMAEYGFEVHAFEKESSLGGAVYTHVPDFRYDHFRLNHFEHRFKELNIQVTYNTVVGIDVFLDDLIDQYESIFIACGLDKPTEIDITHDRDLKIHYAIDLLNRNLYNPNDLEEMLGKTIGIVGLGNVSVDIARTLIRLDKEVHIIYRRTLEEAPASPSEIMEAVNEGVYIHELFGPVNFKKGQSSKVLDCDRTCLIKDPDSSRSKVEVLKDQSVAFNLDDLIFATGQKSSYQVFRDSKVHLVKGKEDYLTNYPSIFVGGDLVNKEKRIVDAMVSGQTVAKLIWESL
ncbi:MAG: FAD-dependent oxidoreductase [Candidatus Izemoplasmatales bacterium]|jgi:glutamate synthase (NADPH/NADH) small chain|nr:FAD-dependent oxidoreductase [Candidatus Izemoplasmatales bacterium]